MIIPFTRNTYLMKSPLNKKRLKEYAGYLATLDDDLARILKSDGPPPLWTRKLSFSTLVLIILEQQVSLASARATFLKLEANLKPFTPEKFIELGSSYLRSLGITRQKASYCINTAQAINAGQLDFKALTQMDDVDVSRCLTRIKGIGPWTASIFLLMALGRPDIWPPGDIALINALVNVKGLKERPSLSVIDRIVDKWRPYRSVAARMLWHHYLSNKSKT